MATWTVSDLEYWDERIREKVVELGLSCFPQEFEIYDHHDMLGAMAYHGMPSHYPHWSYGKSFEKLKTMYDYGASGLPYEMVINSSPSLAYLMRDNTLLLQILTIAHVYGHNDFFKNNLTFAHTAPEHVLSRFKARANRVRTYVEDPSIGVEQVERVLDAAHALAFQCRRNLGVKKLSAAEERERQLRASRPREDPYGNLHKRPDYHEPDLHKNPPAPDEDLLLFIRDNNPYLAEWEQDLLTIVHEETSYFIPVMETKIANEGWASFWHREILNSLELPQDLYLEFLVRHNQVVRPIPGQINPYNVGLKVWDDIVKRFDTPTPLEREEYGRQGGEGRDKLFEVRTSDRDASFLRRFLTKTLMEELDLFEYRARGDDLIVSEVSDEEGWQEVKATLIKQVGMGSIPIIKVEDGSYNGVGGLLLKHYHDGRDLHLSYAERTLAYVHQLWNKEIVLETIIDEHPVELSYNDRGLSSRAL